MKSIQIQTFQAVEVFSSSREEEQPKTVKKTSDQRETEWNTPKTSTF